MATPILEQDREKESQVERLVHDEDYIVFGNQRYLKSELQEAFGGSLNVGLSPPQKFEFGNPGPLGLSGFALTTFVLSLINCEARGVTIPNVVVGLAYFYGGAAQMIAGFMEIALGNSFGSLALCSYGGFWLGYAAILTPTFAIADAYAAGGQEDLMPKAIGIYLIAWFIFTFFLMLMTMKSTVAFFLIFFFLTWTFLCLALGELCDSTNCKKAGGVLGLITAFCAWYNAYAGIANPQNSYLPVKAIHLPDLQDKSKAA